ncbi:MAG: phage terminase large subunit [Methanobrevibacter sp.]|jgi:PBSX family phage terminase large subunit|nr:phage terminase large subunit [Candidatus Methanovirga aequatorialis]
MEFEFGRKASEFIFTPLKYFNHLHGSISSGKTINGLIVFIREVGLSDQSVKHALASKSLQNIKRNLLPYIREICEDLELSYKERLGDQKLIIGGRTVFMIGVNDDRSESKIKGLTVDGVLFADEFNIYDKAGCKMLFSRCRGVDSKIITTNNPMGKRSWAQVDYIDNPKTDKMNWHFTLEDNLSLPDFYVDQLYAQYPEGSMEYNRYILGICSAASGLIYPNFNENNHVVPNTYSRANNDHLVYSLDYGASNVSTVLEFAYDQFENNIILSGEFYYDAKRSNRTLTDQELFDRVRECFPGLDKFATIVVPHDAASMKSLFRENNFNTITYMTRFFEDVETVRKYFANEWVHIHERCENTISQLADYRWNEKKSEVGEDVPLKLDDHCCDAFRNGLAWIDKQVGSFVRYEEFVPGLHGGF